MQGEEFNIQANGVEIHGVRMGQGEPLLLLHGHPETCLMWHKVAPQLAERFTVVATDLRGGAALAVAGLAAEGVTTVQGIGHIQRGYADLAGDLRALGARITAQ